MQHIQLDGKGKGVQPESTPMTADPTSLPAGPEVEPIPGDQIKGSKVSGKESLEDAQAEVAPVEVEGEAVAKKEDGLDAPTRIVECKQYQAERQEGRGVFVRSAAEKVRRRGGRDGWRRRRARHTPNSTARDDCAEHLEAV